MEAYRPACRTLLSICVNRAYLISIYTSPLRTGQHDHGNDQTHRLHSAHEIIPFALLSSFSLSLSWSRCRDNDEPRES